MKVSIFGTAKLVDGDPWVSFVAKVVKDGKEEVKTVNLPFFDKSTTDAEKESARAAMTSGELHKLVGYGHMWLYRGKVVMARDTEHLSEEEEKLEVVNAVLKHEKRYTQLRRQQEAYARIEHTDAARRERIPDDVRLFVWQRDEGKCVKCGGTERLEFDHIVPVAKGGSNTERNIQLLCEACNRAKGTNI